MNRYMHGTYMVAHGLFYNREKSVQIRSFFWSVFFCIRTEYGYLLHKCPYSVQIQENTDQKTLRDWP